uniref:PPM-type phosphatase domain-containing protein n=1 Tax=Macrostomum lignano TaxID=282301 RepID=A0A1I8JPK2_9PLAT
AQSRAAHAESHHQSQQENLFRVAVDQESRQLTFQLMERAAAASVSGRRSLRRLRLRSAPPPPSEDPAPDVAASVERWRLGRPGGARFERAKLRIRQVFLVPQRSAVDSPGEGTQAADAANGAEEAELPADAELPAEADPSGSERQRVQWQRDIFESSQGYVWFPGHKLANLPNQARTSELFQGVTYWDQMEIRRSQRSAPASSCTPPLRERLPTGPPAGLRQGHPPAVTQAKRARLADWLAPAKPIGSGWLGSGLPGVAAGQRLRTTGLGLRTSRIMLSPGSTDRRTTPITATGPAAAPAAGPAESLTTEVKTETEPHSEPAAGQPGQFEPETPAAETVASREEVDEDNKNGESAKVEAEESAADNDMWFSSADRSALQPSNSALMPRVRQLPPCVATAPPPAAAAWFSTSAGLGHLWGLRRQRSSHPPSTLSSGESLSAFFATSSSAALRHPPLRFISTRYGLHHLRRRSRSRTASARLHDLMHRVRSTTMVRPRASTPAISSSSQAAFITRSWCCASSASDIAPCKQTIKL